jgi:diguanylate cyclase (GGDEF)-like protein
MRLSGARPEQRWWQVMAEVPPIGTEARRWLFAGLCLAQAAVAAPLALFVIRSGTPAPHDGLVAFLLLTACMVAAESVHFDLELRRQAQSINAGEFVMVLGLLTVHPRWVVAAWAVGGLVGELRRHRREPHKFVFNVAAVVLQAAVAASCFTLLGGTPTPLRPWTWLAVAVSVATASTLSTLPLLAVFRLYGERLGRRELVDALVVGAGAHLIGATVALIAAVLVAVQPAGVVLAGALLALIVLAHRGYVRLRRRNADLRAVYDFTRTLGTTRSDDQLFGALLAETRRLLRCAAADLVLREWPGVHGSLRVRLTDAAIDRSPALPADLEPLTAFAAGRGPLVVPPAPADAGERLVAPLNAAAGVVGLLAVGDRRSTTRRFDRDDRQLLETLSRHAAVAVERERLTVQLWYDARYDSLTGLGTRTRWLEEADEVVRTSPGAPLAVLHLGLNRFREVNRTLGYTVGDRLLQLVAGLVSTATGPGGPAVVARLNGDQFVALLPGADRGQAVAEARRLRDALSRVVAVDGLPVAVDVSVGVAPGRAAVVPAEQLQHRAEAALHAAKRDVLGVAVFSPERDEANPRRLALAAHLRRAVDLADGQLFPVYQPKVAARCDREHVRGVEVLLRWCHEQEGLVAPSEFIPVAESSGLIRDLTMLVLDAALAQCRQWLDQRRSVPVAVNLSTRTLLDRSLAATVARNLHRHDVPPGHLVLEITESALMVERARSADLLAQLSVIGVRLSIDDFGTGYSSLSYLSQLPVDEVKIDRSFVSRMRHSDKDAAIVRSVIELGHNLGLEVVAEGVEDVEVLDALRALGCDTIQGSLITAPMPGDAATKWLRAASVDVPAAAARSAYAPHR